jgi:hypothetical protein
MLSMRDNCLLVGWACASQHCGTVTIFYGSSSDFWKVMVPVPVPTFEKVMVPVTIPTFEKLRFRFRFWLFKKLRFQFRFRFHLSKSYSSYGSTTLARASWMSMRKNWLLVGWACAKIGFSQAEHMRKSFWPTTCMLRVFLSSSCHPFLCSLLPSLSNVLCPLSEVFALCLLAYVPCLMSLFLVYRPLSPVSRLGFLFPNFCTLPRE